jgi:exonuclease SbcD
MKILHTSDWHLGKKTEGKDRIAEQRQALSEICALAESKGVNIAVISGDIFDTFTPSADAEDLFYESITALSDGGKRLVAVISGNHDDPSRLCAASALAQKNAIIISGGGEECFNFPPHCAVKLIECGKGYVKVNIGGEEAVINYLPFPSDSRLNEIAQNIDYASKIKSYLKTGNEKFSDKTVNITIAHLFCAGALPTGEEREIEAGGVKACPAEVFSEKCHYVALGHIHRHQKIKENVFYSGSILQYSADESTDKSVIIIEADSTGIKNVERCGLKSGKKIINYTAESFDEAYGFVKNSDDYIYLKIRQDKPLLYNESKQLKAFDNLLAIELEKSSGCSDGEIISRKHFTDRELFTAYYEHKYGAKPDEELVNLFLEILGEQVEA